MTELQSQRHNIRCIRIIACEYKAIKGYLRNAVV